MALRYLLEKNCSPKQLFNAKHFAVKIIELDIKKIK